MIMNFNDLNWQPSITYSEPNSEALKVLEQEQERQERRTMTKDEAIKVLKKDLQTIDDKEVTMTVREWEEHDDNMRDALGVALEALEQVPKTGHWILSDMQYPEEVTNDNYQYICSECGSSDLHSKTTIVPYCWYCGARME